MVTIRQLTYFVAAAQTGSATRAAQVLNVSQPSISAAIRELEAELGRTLFVRRQSQGLELTDAGADKLREARAIVAQARSFSAPGAGGRSRRLTLAYFSTIGPSWVPGILHRLGRDLPDFAVDLRECDLEEIARFLERGIVDLAISYDVGIPPAMARETLAEITPYAVLAEDHPLAAQEAVTLAELARYPFILVDLPLSREFLMVPFWRQGLSPDIVLRTGSVEMVRSMVANGLGVSLLFTRPSHDLTHDGKRVVSRPVRDDTLAQRVVVACDATRAEETGLASAIAVVRGLARGQGGSPGQA